MKGLKIFGWVCFGMGVFSLLLSHALEYIGLNWGYFYDEYSLHWTVASLVFFLAAILSRLTCRALKQLREELELKLLMNT